MNNIARLKHQQQAVDMFRSRNFGALFMEMGLGKTLTALDITENDQRILFITKKTVIPDIIRQIKQYTDKEYYVLTTKSIKHMAEEFNTGIYVTNYEFLLYNFKWLYDRSWDAMILDESNAIKSSTSQRTKQCIMLGEKARRRFILTGTPLTKGYEDLFTQFKFLSGTILPKYKTTFQNHYCVMRQMWNKSGKQFPCIAGYKNIFKSTDANIPALIDLVSPYTFTATKKECLDLPEQTYTTITVEMPPEIRRLYKQIKTELVLTLEKATGEIDTMLIENIFSKIAKLHQLSNWFIYTDDGKECTVFKENSKIKWLEENVDAMVEKENKLIIFYKFKQTGRDVVAFLTQQGIKHVQITADQTLEERGKAINQFQTDTNTKVFACPISMGSHGITVTAANYCVYLNCDDDFGVRHQSESRLHRIGQTRNVHYIDIVTEDTVEGNIIRRNNKKKELLVDAVTTLEDEQIDRLANIKDLIE